MEKNVAEHIVDLLCTLGVRHVFGVPSGDWLPYMEALDKGDIEFVLVANEASAGFMATVYGWLKGVPGVCYATMGPGATNLSTGVGCALLDRSPVIAFTTEPSDKMLGCITQMAIDQQALMGSVTKFSTRLVPAELDKIFEEAVVKAYEEPAGPVHIGLPNGCGSMPLTFTSVNRIKLPSIKECSEKELLKMESLFNNSVKPLLAVGLTAVRLGLSSEIVRIAEKHSIPVVLTPMAKGLIREEHSSYAGVLFHALSNYVAETNRQADLVVGIGYDPVEFNYEEWMPEVPLIHIDTVVADIDRTVYKEVFNVTGNPVQALKRLGNLNKIKSEWDINKLQKRKQEMFEKFLPKGDNFGPLAVLSILREILPEDGIMTCDVGSHTHLIGQAWRTPHPYGQLMTNGWSSMGFGIPAAIGAKLAVPEKNVVCITGDGSFMMMAGEMATAKRLNLNIVFIVLADRQLGLIRLKQKKRGIVTDDTLLSEQDIPSSNYVFGVPVVRVSDQKSYREALIEGFKSEGPVIVEAIIDPSEYDDLLMKKHK